MVGISVDPADKSRELAEGASLSFPLLEDRGLAVARSYGVADEANDIAMTATFVVSSGGEITWKYVGKNPMDRPPLDDVLKAAAAAAGR